MTRLLLFSCVLASAAEILTPRIILASPGLVASVTDYAVDSQGNRYINGGLTLPSTFRTTKDGGLTWQGPPFVPTLVGVYPPRPYSPVQVIVDPVDSNVLYDCSGQGIVRSNDGGRLWYLLREGYCRHSW